MQPITRIRYNDDYELLVKEIINYNINQFSCYEDVLLYVTMLDGDWKLPNDKECMHILVTLPRYNSWTDRILMENNHYWDYWDKYAKLLSENTNNIRYMTILAVSQQYKPTKLKRIKLWLKNTTVANIVTRF